MMLKVTPVSVQERRGSITANSKKKGWKYFTETKRLLEVDYLELTVSKKSNINLHILPWALCWLASIGAGPENQKEHHYLTTTNPTQNRYTVANSTSIRRKFDTKSTPLCRKAATSSLHIKYTSALQEETWKVAFGSSLS